MNQYLPRLSLVDVTRVTLFVLAMTLLLALVLSMSEPGRGGGDPDMWPREAPAGLGL